MSLEALFDAAPYTLAPQAKDAALLAELTALTVHHRERCGAYGRALAAFGGAAPAARLEDVPWIPVSLFKSHALRSVAADAVFAELRSSGTTGQVPSRIALDRETAALQSRALAHIMTSVLGPRRLPMIILERPDFLRSPAARTARGAGVLGMMSFGRDHLFALVDDDRLDAHAVARFTARHAGGPILVFGFTFVAWRALVAGPGPRVAIPGGVLVHGGGWKRLAAQAVDRATFRAAVREAAGIERVHDFYGMVEQVGSVFLECEEGLLHAPHFADVVVRDPATLAPCTPGVPGLLQVLSALPRSYPGHSLLTEDMGVVVRRDGCPCGWRGTALSVTGRAPRVELRGCSDTRGGAA